jgi:hypothetical protein
VVTKAFTIAAALLAGSGAASAAAAASAHGTASVTIVEPVRLSAMRGGGVDIDAKRHFQLNEGEAPPDDRERRAQAIRYAATQRPLILAEFE